MKKERPEGEQRIVRRRPRHLLLKFVGFLALLAAGGVAGDYALQRTLCRAGEWHGPKSDHFDGSRFFNPSHLQENYGAGKFLSWMAERHSKAAYPDATERAHTPQLAPELAEDEWEATMINHSTMLLRLQGCNILTDPVWSDYTSPVPFVGPKRHCPPGMSMEELPPIDVCLLSHDHYDHFDVPSLKRLNALHHPLFIVPLGLKSLLEYHLGAGVRVTEMDWWYHCDYKGVRFHITPAHHWSKRYRTEASSNRSLWCGFYMQADKGPKLYYVGDSALAPCFAQIYRRLGAPDLALIPIGAYKPDWIRQHHLSPTDAVKAFTMLHAHRAIACHFGTWQMANDGYEETLEDLDKARRSYGIPAAHFLAPQNGQSFRGRKF